MDYVTVLIIGYLTVAFIRFTLTVSSIPAVYTEVRDRQPELSAVNMALLGAVFLVIVSLTWPVSLMREGFRFFLMQESPEVVGALRQALDQVEAEDRQRQ